LNHLLVETYTGPVLSVSSLDTCDMHFISLRMKVLQVTQRTIWNLDPLNRVIAECMLDYALNAFW